jgi:hypothetical protein
VSDLSRRLASVPDDHLIAELQSALDNLNLADLPTPGLTPHLGTPVGEDDPDHSRDTFVPHPTRPEPCESCYHDLELNADFRCVRCGFQY